MRLTLDESADTVPLIPLTPGMSVKLPGHHLGEILGGLYASRITGTVQITLHLLNGCCEQLEVSAKRVHR